MQKILPPKYLVCTLLIQLGKRMTVVTLSSFFIFYNVLIIYLNKKTPKESVFFSGVYWTKFECILPKILTKNEMRLGHARGLACAKTKKFPCIFLASPPPTPPPRSGKEMERKFLVLLRRSHNYIVL